MLWVTDVLLLFCLRTEAKRGKAEYKVLHFMQSTPTLHEVDKELGCVCPRCGTSNEEDQRAIAKTQLSNRTELNVGEWSEAEAFSAMRGVKHIVQSNYAILPLSGALRCP